MENKKAGVWIKQKSKSVISNELSRFRLSGEKRVQDLCIQNLPWAIAVELEDFGGPVAARSGWPVYVVFR